MHTSSDLLGRLGRLVAAEIPNIFYGVGGNIPELCNDLEQALRRFNIVSEDTNPFKAPEFSIFLKSTLPTLIEVFLRRKTLR
jgi:hypothetical protein